MNLRGGHYNTDRLWWWMYYNICFGGCVIICTYHVVFFRAVLLYLVTQTSNFI